MKYVVIGCLQVQFKVPVEANSPEEAADQVYDGYCGDVLDWATGEYIDVRDVWEDRE